MNSRFIATDAVRQALKARIGLTGVTNSGKTWSALLIATGILIAENAFKTPVDTSNIDFHNQEQVKEILSALDWSKIAVIDTERKRSLFYADNETFGVFKHINFEPPYSPLDYIEAVKYAESLGCLVVIIDSISHAWSGTGGVLDIVQEKTAQSRTKNAFNEGWGGKEGGTALQNRMIDQMLSSNVHIIATFRQKPEYVQEKDPETGKTRITLVGSKPIQKDDLEYEFDITLRLERDHSARIIKNTVQFIQPDIVVEGEQILKPLSIEFGFDLGRYLAQGVDSSEINEETRLKIIDQLKSMAKQNKPLASYYKQLHPNKKTDELTLAEAKEVLKQFKEVL